jgi:prefoldin subunit 5
MTDVLGEEIGMHRAEIDDAIAALSRNVNAYHRRIGDLRRQIDGLKSEIDLLRQMLPLGTRSVEVGDALKLLRQTAGAR